MTIGITGRIATGKSTVSEILEKKGFFRIDADSIYHLLRNSNEEMNNEIFMRFKSLDNKKILKAVSSDKNALADLNSITHKYVIAEIQNQMHACSSDKIILEVQVPVKHGFQDLADYIIVTTCSPDIQLKRIIDRDKCNEISALRKINMQMADEKYCKLGDLVINTDNITGSELEIVLDNTLKALLK